MTLEVLSRLPAAGDELEEVNDAPLRSLQADPMGSYSPPGARLVRNRGEGERTGGLMGKPSEAHLRRLFALPASRADAAFSDAVDAARAAGWTVEEVYSATGVVGDKRLPSGNAYMTIIVATDRRLMPEGVQPQTIGISLGHTR